MNKDIHRPPVENVTLAVSHETGLDGTAEWKVYLLNNNPVDIDNTLVASCGYGEKDGAEQRTSTLRHFLQTVPAHSVALIEPIDPGVFHLHNEYWVSYYIGRDIYDKKFVFVPDSIQTEHLIFIPELQKKGVLHS